MKKKMNIGVEVDEKIVRQLDRIADEMEGSRSQLIRLAINAWLKARVVADGTPRRS